MRASHYEFPIQFAHAHVQRDNERKREIKGDEAKIELKIFTPTSIEDVPYANAKTTCTHQHMQPSTHQQ